MFLDPGQELRHPRVDPGEGGQRAPAPPRHDPHLRVRGVALQGETQGAMPKVAVQFTKHPTENLTELMPKKYYEPFYCTVYKGILFKNEFL